TDHSGGSSRVRPPLSSQDLQLTRCVQLMAIQSMVARKDTEGRVLGPSQRIPVGQALRVCTMNGAYCSFEEKAKGSITDGKLGDFVILEKDPHDVDPDHIKEIRVLRTVMDGKTTHER